MASSLALVPLSSAALAEKVTPALPSPEALEKIVKTEIDAFRAAMQSGDFKTFYDRGSRQFRDAVKLEDIDKQLRPMVGAFEPLALVMPLKPTYTEPPRIDENGTLLLRGHFDDPKKIITFSIDMVRDDGDWRFLNVNVNHDTPDRPAVAGTVVPQDKRLPLPPPEKIEELLRSNIALFSNAMKTGNFEELHARGSGPTQKASTVQEMRETLGPMARQFADLDKIAGVPPQYSEPPRVDENGLLQLHGHFDVSGKTIKFDVVLVPEDGTWSRFEDMSVNVK